MMSNPKMFLSVAVLAVAMTTASTTQAADPKKKQFFDMLNASVSAATNTSQGASPISQASFASRVSSPSSGIQAATARNSLTFRQYQRLVYRELVQNRLNLFAALRLYQVEVRNGTISRANYNASRANALHIFTGYKTGLLSEYSSGTPYIFTTTIGLGPQAIHPGSFVVRITPRGINTNPQIVPPLTTIR